MLENIRFRLRHCARFNLRIVRTLLWTCFALQAPAPGQCIQLPSPVLVSRCLPETLSEIALLGSDDFRVRRDASQRLLAEPLLSHDWVYRARYSSDCEIAQSARQLLLPIQIQLLAQHAPQYYYSTQNAGSPWMDSEKAIFRISRSNDPDSAANLLAIVQYEPREDIALRAVVELLSANFKPDALRSELLALANSPRTTSQCLGIWYSQFDSPNDFLFVWRPIATQILARYPCEADVLPAHVIVWLRASASRYRAIGLDDAADELTMHIIAHVSQRPNDLVELYDWLLFDNAINILNHVNGQCADAIGSDARLLFRLSEFQYRMGEWDQAQQTFAKALNLIQGESGKSVQLAVHMRSSGHERIATGILEQLLTNTDLASEMVLAAGRLLARYHHEQLDDSAAAQVLQDAVDRIQPTAKPTNRSVEIARKDAQIELAYYWHRHFLLQADIEQATRFLVDGLQMAPDNSDLLIAASRFQGDSDDWASHIDELIEISLGKLEKLIRANTAIKLSDSREQRTLEHEQVAAMNSYAWLSSQTGRHLETAETCARLALSQTPDAPELMDTLASCLTARGQYTEAIAVQRQAIRLEPHNPSLQASLARHQEAQARLQSQTTIR